MARGETLGKLIPELVKTNPQVRAAEANVAAAREQARVALGAWFPGLTVTSHYGQENQMKPEAEDTFLRSRELDFSVTQLLWDFGATNSALRSARLNIENQELALDLLRENLILAGVQEYLNLMKWNVLERISHQLIAKIEDQIELMEEQEKANTEPDQEPGPNVALSAARGSLADERIRLADARFALDTARSSFRRIFGKEPPPVESMMKPVLPSHLVPETVDEVVNIALERDIRVKLARIASQAAGENVKRTRASSFYPTLNAVGDLKFKESVGGTAGFQREALAKIELSFPFNLGFTAVNTLRAAKHGVGAAGFRLTDARRAYEADARTNWAQIHAAQKKIEHLTEAAKHYRRFVEDAKATVDAEAGSRLMVVLGEVDLLKRLH